jgi:hypothetical protein
MANDKYTFFVPDASKFQDSQANYVGVNILDNLYPSNFAQRIDSTMLNLSKICNGIGGEIEFLNTKVGLNKIMALVCFVEKENVEEYNAEIVSIFRLLTDMAYVIPLNDINSSMPKYRITANGWMKIQEMQSKNKVLPQAFIAMCFDEKMKDARDSIIRAIEDCEYLHVIIDEKEHNNQIVPEIFYEIKRSAFVVVDLSEHRNGVYYEAGYAQALDKEVILSCKEDDFNNRHFDVAQKNTIVWKDENDLYNRLVKRIRAQITK